MEPVARTQWMRRWVNSSVVRAADCRSAGPWLKSGCALLHRFVAAARLAYPFFFPALLCPLPSLIDLFDHLSRRKTCFDITAPLPPPFKFPHARVSTPRHTMPVLLLTMTANAVHASRHPLREMATSSRHHIAKVLSGQSALLPVIRPSAQIPPWRVTER